MDEDDLRYTRMVGEEPYGDFYLFFFPSLLIDLTRKASVQTFPMSRPSEGGRSRVVHV
jgi:hypothetical protein